MWAGGERHERLLQLGAALHRPAAHHAKGAARLGLLAEAGGDREVDDERVTTADGAEPAVFAVGAHHPQLARAEQPVRGRRVR